MSNPKNEIMTIEEVANYLRLKPQTIYINELDILYFNLPDLTLRIRCSKGTYIRSLARDIGRSLKSGAHLTGLRRTKIGEYTVDSALNPEEFEKKIIKL